MAGLGRAMAAGEGVDVRLTAATDRRSVLSGADFVVLSAAVQGAQRWKMDFDVLSAVGMPEQARECGGMGGLGYALRSITLVSAVCRDIEQYCPKALLLSVTNPLPRVLTAVHRHTAVRPVGFCNAAWHAPDTLKHMEKLLAAAAKIARWEGKEKVLLRLALVRAGFNYLKDVATIAHLDEAHRAQVALVSNKNKSRFEHTPLNWDTAAKRKDLSPTEEPAVAPEPPEPDGTP
jgi:hypothetical protein